MSCKILAPAELPQVRPLEWRELNTPARKPAPQPEAEPEPQPGPDPAEIQRLQNRIAELERSLSVEVRKAHDQGFQAGHMTGQQSAAEELKPVLERLARSCMEVAGLGAKIRREAESDLVTLTIAIAHRVLRRELSVDPDAIHGVVKAALGKMQSKEISAVRAHPDHVSAIRAYFDKAGLSAGIEITPDASLALGGVIFQTKRGDLNASIDTQLKEIERGFTDRLGH